MNQLTDKGISRKGKCSIWQSTSNQYTLKTSSDKWYTIITSFIDGKMRTITQPFSASLDYIPSGTLLHTIPTWLMHITFKLQKKQKPVMA